MSARRKSVKASRLNDLPHLKRALDLLGVDNGATAKATAKIPPSWEMPAQLANEELRTLSPQEMETLVMGEESEAGVIAAKNKNADAVLCAAFDGPLSDIFFEPWRSIYDARRTERRVLL